jgi:hypothetical protein
VSFIFDGPDEANFDDLLYRLSEWGNVLMPPAQYLFARRLAWLSDRYGVAGQLVLNPALPTSRCGACSETSRYSRGTPHFRSNAQPNYEALRTFALETV